MSTQVKGFITGIPRLTVQPDVTGAAYIQMASIEGEWNGACVNRADFLAAVAKELDVIVIERADLPEVRTLLPGVIGTSTACGTATADNHRLWREDALHSLALAEYLDAHPPVDEAQVEALAGLLDSALDEQDGARGNADAIARRLVASGRVKVE